MVQQLRTHERAAWREEQYGRLMFAIDRENQADSKERVRTVVYRAIEAKYRAAHREVQP